MSQKEPRSRGGEIFPERNIVTVRPLWTLKLDMEKRTKRDLGHCLRDAS
jgi:hypothetical protein